MPKILPSGIMLAPFTWCSDDHGPSRTVPPQSSTASKWHLSYHQLYGMVGILSRPSSVCFSLVPPFQRFLSGIQTPIAANMVSLAKGLHHQCKTLVHLLHYVVKYFRTHSLLHHNSQPVPYDHFHHNVEELQGDWISLSVSL